MSAGAFAVAPPAVAAPSVPAGSRVVACLLDRRFWMVEGAIAAVTAVHAVAEVSGAHETGVGSHVGLQAVLVLLYLGPVVYASLTFGFEGGVLASACSIVLAIPNIFLFHTAGYEWVGELVAMGVVLGVGVAVAVPVEHERRERRRAEASARRLALVNGIAALLVEARDPATVLEALLDRLVDGAGLDGAAVALADQGATPVVRSRMPDGADALRAALTGSHEPFPPGPIVTVFPLSVEGSTVGSLAVQARRPLPADDHAALNAVALHLALEVENARFHRQERERIEAYARTVLAAQEAERKRIARDLHDDVAQNLLHLGRSLGGFRDVDGTPAEVADRAEDLRALSLSTLALVRDFAHDLRPTALTDLGLAPALARATREHGGRCGAEVEFSVEGAERRLPPETEVAAFRIAQEALRNVEKHSEATHLAVALRYEADRLRISIVDDGRGFGTGGGASGLGIDGMRERAELEGGTLAIRSGPGGGVAVEVTLPA